MKKISLFLLIIVLISSCRKSDETDYTAGQFGWTVGSIHDGYGTIFHTNNGGKLWARQGNAENLPATSLLMSIH